MFPVKPKEEMLEEYERGKSEEGLRLGRGGSVGMMDVYGRAKGEEIIE